MKTLNNLVRLDNKLLKETLNELQQAAIDMPEFAGNFNWEILAIKSCLEEYN